MWFVIFGICVLLIGGALVRIVDGMSQRIMLESAKNRYSDISLELDKTNQLQDVVSSHLYSIDRIDVAACSTLARTVLSLDSKLTAFWVASGGEQICFHRSENNEIVGAADSRAELYCEGMHERDSVIYQSFVLDVESPILSTTLTVGFDIALDSLYNYMAAQSVMVNGYAVIANSDQQIFLHPDSLKLTSHMGSTSEAPFIMKALSTEEAPTRKLDSQHLSIPVFRQYFAHDLFGGKVVVMISVPYIVVSDELEMFSKYSLVIIIVALILFVLLLVVFRILLLREFRLRSKAEQQAASLQLEMVVNTMDQHFLFNCFNSLYTLIGRDKEQSRKFVLSLSKVYRNVLEKDKKPMSPLAKELQFMNEYYFLQKIRFGEKVELVCEVEGKYDNFSVPSMSVQLLVENAIKHNNITREHPLLIKIYTLDDKLVVENNIMSTGKIETESLGMGLERIKSIYQQYTHTQIEIREDDTKFCCILPLVDNATI